jgi:hypothetical protein
MKGQEAFSGQSCPLSLFFLYTAALGALQPLRRAFLNFSIPFSLSIQLPECFKEEIIGCAFNREASAEHSINLLLVN